MRTEFRPEATTPASDPLSSSSATARGPEYLTREGGPRSGEGAPSELDTDEALRAYLSTRNAVAEAIHEATDALGDCPAARTCQRLLARLAEDRFELVVLGQFDRGKSTLINAILGAEILPTGTLPVTSAITSLRHGDRPRVLVGRRGGALPEEIPIARLSEFVTEQGNPRNEKGVISVDVELPATFLRRGVCFVDTPGVGSIHERNTELTYTYLPEVDAAVFVTSVESPLGATELELLDTVRQYARKLFFVVNKVDQVDAGARQEVLTFTEQTLTARLGVAPTYLFPVSASQALRAKRLLDGPALDASGLPALERALAGFLAVERRNVFLARVLDRAERALDGERAERDLQQEALASPLSEEERVAEFRQRVGIQRDTWREEVRRLRGRADAWRTSWLRPRLEKAQGEARALLGSYPRRSGAESAANALRRQVESWEREHAQAAEGLARELGTVGLRCLAQCFRQLARDAGAVVGQPLLVEDPELRDWTPPRFAEVRSSAPDADPEAGHSVPPSWFRLGRRSRRLGALVVGASDGVEERVAAYVTRCLETLDAQSTHALSVEAERLEARLTRQRTGGADEAREVIRRLQQRIGRLRAAILNPAAASIEPEWTRENTEVLPKTAACDSSRPSPPRPKKRAPSATGCVVCRAVVEEVFDVLCAQQYALATDAGARRIFLATRGWCPPHLWQLQALASPRGLCSALPPLLEQVADEVRHLSGLAGQLAAQRIADIIPDQERCPVCALRARVEQDAARTLTADLRQERERPPWRVPTVCLLHAKLVLTGLNDRDSKVILDQLARRMVECAESMHGYALKVDARRRDLLTRGEMAVYREAVEALAGLMHLIAPVQVG